ncbi:hypothetical protein K431DRAFT_268991 [Polychaeton citri CBS 116435]|uniref:Extracellular membrane protein CFEM domain-containing protein n=1 Tax=Polychaeton citri CBS 116435 TaxID=1314669 RepID=A0A9P4UPV5_9PEZI|nr:hypothetical protein K431DRAFT_268991 [Polychaeton citri CBS 116435]
MRSTFTLTLAWCSIASAALTYNLTQANAPGNLKKYHCWNTLDVLARVPTCTCIWKAQKYANNHDGCAYDDYTCHCANYQVYSDIIEPLVFPPSLGGKGTCTLDELSKARPVLNDMCNFFNATQYADYAGCVGIFSPAVTLAIVQNEPVVISY